MIIDILGIPYTIKEVECVNKDELRKGQINFLSQEILLDKTMTKENKKITLLHETIHGIAEALGFDLEENRVQSLATALYYVASHNSKLFTSLR